jgi:uroporphyrinogen decarboxylase
MNHWERIRSALKGEETDRAPICLWRHWPVDDQRPESLAAATLRWQETYDCDLVKHAPAGSYVVEDWGGRTTYIPEKDPGLGVRTMTRRAVTSVEDWPRLAQLEVTQGHLGSQLEALKLVSEGLEGSVPILQTIFSPLNIARKLGGDRVLSDLREHPKDFTIGLRAIAITVTRFALASIRAGADGVIFSSPCNQGVFSEAEYREFGVPFDRLILQTIRPEAEIIALFATGEGNLLDLVVDYPADLINWRQRPEGPSLQEMQTRFPRRAVMGGINERETLRFGPPAAIRAEIEAVIAESGGRGLVVGTESAPYIDTPAAHFQAAREAVDQ